MQATKSMSGLTMRPKRKTSTLAATINPAMRPTRAEARRVPMSVVSTATATAASADGSRAAISVGPSQAKAAAMSQ